MARRWTPDTGCSLSMHACSLQHPQPSRAKSPAQADQAMACRAAEEASAAAEARDMAAQALDTNIDEPTRVLLPSGQEIEASSLSAPDLAGVQRRIKDVVRVLDDFSRLRDPSRPRKDYVAQVRGSGFRVQTLIP